MRVFDVESPGRPVMTAFPFGAGYAGGIRVAMADVSALARSKYLFAHFRPIPIGRAGMLPQSLLANLAGGRGGNEKGEEKKCRTSAHNVSR